jgi:hypothetical protein
VLQRPHAGNPETVLKVTVGKEDNYYRVEPIPSDWGRAFAVVKVGIGEPDVTYHVNLDDQQDTCDCLGHERWGHCKHVDGLKTLIARGELCEGPP